MAMWWRRCCGSFWLVLLLCGCAPKAVSTPTGTLAPALPTLPPTVVARPAPSPSLLGTPGMPMAASPTAERPTAAIAASPTGAATPIRNGDVTVITGHTGPVDVVAWSPDGTRFATSSGVGNSPDQSVRLWRADGTPLAVLPATTFTGRALAWSPDGRTLATSAIDGAVLFWTAEGELIGTLSSEPDPVLSLAWSPDGQMLAVGAVVTSRSTTVPFFSGVVRLWRPDGQLLATIRTQATGGKFLHLFWSPDGALLAGGAIDFYLWRADGTVVATLRGGGTPAPAMDWSPRGDRIAIGDENGILLIYDGSGKLFTSGGRFGGGAVWDVSFSPDGRTLAIVSGNGVSLLSLDRPDAEPRPFSGGAFRPDIRHTANPAWSPDGSRLAVAMRDGMLWVRGADGTPLAILDGCPGEILRLAWSPDGRTLVAGSQGGVVCMWRG